jgi:type IV pilus assembly protein PilM
MGLMKLINLKHSDVIGLDIGSSAVKIIVLDKAGKGYKVKAVGITEIACTCENNLDNTSLDYNQVHANTVKAIQECFSMANIRAKAKLRTNFAVCGVSGSEVAVRDFAFPPLPPEEIESATALEAEVVCPFNAGQASIDYQLMSNNDKKTKGIFVAATNTVITNKIQYAKEASLKCVLVDVDGLALLNCFNNFVNGPEKKAAAILNVGGSYTTLAIMNSDGWPFIRDTAYAGNDILKHISAGNNIPVEELKSVLFNDSKENLFESGNSMETACEELIAGVTETLRFYATQEKAIPVRKIYVCGGFAGARGFMEMLNRKLGMETVLWNPFDNVSCNASQGCRDILKKNGHVLAVAAGLAMRSI